MTKIRDELLDELLAGYQGPEDLLGPGGLLKRLTGALVERAIGAELPSTSARSTLLGGEVLRTWSERKPPAGRLEPAAWVYGPAVGDH